MQKQHVIAQKVKNKQQYNETILSVQYCKLLRDNSKSVEEWMGQIRMNANVKSY